MGHKKSNLNQKYSKTQKKTQYFICSNLGIRIFIDSSHYFHHNSKTKNIFLANHFRHVKKGVHPIIFEKCSQSKFRRQDQDKPFANKIFHQMVAYTVSKRCVDISNNIYLTYNQNDHIDDSQSLKNITYKFYWSLFANTIEVIDEQNQFS